MLHIGKLDGRCTDLQMKEHNRALMNGDPGCWHYNTWKRSPRRQREEIQDMQKVQTVETAYYSLELETLSFLIVHVDVAHNMGGWELHDCMWINMGAEHGRLVTA